MVVLSSINVQYMKKKRNEAAGIVINDDGTLLMSR
jgi:hypothetical protein